jgi:hypothetical protein
MEEPVGVRGPHKKPERLKFVRISITLPPGAYGVAMRGSKIEGSVSAYLADLVTKDARRVGRLTRAKSRKKAA